MSRFVLDGIVIPAGTLSIEFVNNNGSNSVVSLPGNFIKTIGKLKETVEDNGIGGIPVIGSLELELYDREGVIRDSVLNVHQVNVCYVIVNVTSGGVVSNVFYGSVDLGSIECESMYEGDDGSEKHFIKFQCVGVLDVLRSVSMSTLRQYLYDHHMQAAPLYYIKMVNIGDVLRSVFRYLDETKTVSVSFTFRHKLYSDTADMAEYPDRAYLQFYRYDGPDVGYVDLWSETYANSFMSFASVFDFVQQLCGMLLVYPVVSYDASTGGITVELLHRHGGLLLAPGWGLLSSVQKTFWGYDYIRVVNADGAGFAGLDRRISPYVGAPIYTNGISDEDFALQQRKFDFRNYLTYGNIPRVADPSYTFLYMHSGLVYAHNAVYDVRNDVWGLGINLHLVKVFEEYWGSSKRTFVRKYASLGIGAALLQKIELSGNEFAIFDIERDVFENTVTLKCCEY